jgi:hypothetical protein
MFDFLALDKTGIIFVLPHEQLRHHDGEALLSEDPKSFLANAFIHIEHPLEIGAAVEAALQDNPERRQAADNHREQLFFGLDGQASQRVKTTIEQLLAQGGQTNRP